MTCVDMHKEGLQIMKRSAGKLTPMQRRILSAMSSNDLGFAAFNGDDSRKKGFGVFAAKDGGIVVRAYGTPEFFLSGRHLIERQERNVPGVWFRITEKGRAAISTSQRGTE